MRFNSFFLLFTVVSVLFLPSCQSIEKRKVYNIAHRGGIVPEYPENTLMAFKKCIDLGVDYIELDLRISRDGEIVIIHDETLDRTTNGSGSVADFTLKELKTFDAGQGETIPTLKEVLQLISGSNVKLLFDIKLSKELDPEKILSEVHEFDMLSDIIFGIRSLEDLAKFQKLDTGLHTLGFLPDSDQVDDFIENGVDIIRLKQGWLSENPGLISSLQGQGIIVFVWTTENILSDAELLSLVETGIDGILYNDPEQLQRLIRKSD